jgi:hypothetical protein
MSNPFLHGVHEKWPQNKPLKFVLFVTLLVYNSIVGFEHELSGHLFLF